MRKHHLTPLKSKSTKSLEKRERNNQFGEPGFQTQRTKRDHLKHYLSSNEIKIPSSLTKKTFELTETNLFLPTSPRILQKIAYSNDQHKCTKEKCIDKMIALKIANKNVLKVFSSHNFRSNDSKKEPVLITLPEELKILDQESVSERTEAQKLLEWFEVMKKNQLDQILNRKQLVMLNISQQENGISLAGSILSLGLKRLIEQVQTHCNEKAVMIEKLFESFKDFWKVSGKIEQNIQKVKYKDLCNQLDDAKSEIISMHKTLKTETHEVRNI